MANANTPYGFRPVRHHGGGHIQYSEWPIASAYATDVFTGDVVKQISDGSIQVAAAGNALVLGVFMGVFYTDPNSKKPRWAPYWPASTVATDAVAKVIDDPRVVYSVQMNGTYTTAMPGENADLDAAVAGIKPQGVSGMQLSATTGTATKQFRILGLVLDPTNAAGASAKVLVIQNESQLAQATGT